jgi:hypothetical protein
MAAAQGIEAPFTMLREWRDANATLDLLVSTVAAGALPQAKIRLIG